jgi:hypothetical protein
MNQISMDSCRENTFSSIVMAPVLTKDKLYQIRLNAETLLTPNMYQYHT